MIPYNLLRNFCGLSHQEAAIFHGVRLDTVKSWCAGRNNAPRGVISEITSLAQTIIDRAHAIVKSIEGVTPEGVECEIGYPVDDQEAQALGLPFVSSWQSMAAIVIATLDCKVTLLPHGSTSATAAIEARKK
jgi:hypothetical protein